MPSPRLECRWAAVDAVLAEPNIGALIDSYWRDLSPFKGDVPLAPDFAHMRRLEADGTFRVWGAYRGERLVGFILFHIYPHLMYRTTLFASEAGHYLDPLHRGDPWCGFRMWRSAAAALKEAGVKVAMAHDNAAFPLHWFFMRLGFRPQSLVYWRVL